MDIILGWAAWAWDSSILGAARWEAPRRATEPVLAASAPWPGRLTRAALLSGRVLRRLMSAEQRILMAYATAGARLRWTAYPSSCCSALPTTAPLRRQLCQKCYPVTHLCDQHVPYNRAAATRRNRFHVLKQCGVSACRMQIRQAPSTRDADTSTPSTRDRPDTHTSEAPLPTVPDIQWRTRVASWRRPNFSAACP